MAPTPLSIFEATVGLDRAHSVVATRPRSRVTDLAPLTYIGSGGSEPWGSRRLAAFSGHIVTDIIKMKSNCHA